MTSQIDFDTLMNHDKEDDKAEESMAILRQRLLSDNIGLKFHGHMGEGVQCYKYSETKEGGRIRSLQWPMASIFATDSLGFRLLRMEHTLDVSQALINEQVPPTLIIDRWIAGEQTEPVSCGESFDCYECGERLQPQFDGHTVEFLTSSNSSGYDIQQCKYAGGMGEYTVQIDVPSGLLVFANDFRRMVPEHKSFPVNNNNGVRQTVEYVAELSMFTAFVGNTSPTVFYTEDSIIVGSNGTNDEDEELTNLGSDCGYICTDLWWFYAMDGDMHTSRGATVPIEVSVVVVPGVYEMTVHQRISDYDRDWEAAIKYATIKRVGDII